MTRAFALLPLLMVGCFDTDPAEPAPEANPIAPTVGSVAAAPVMARQEGPPGGGGRDRGALGEADIDLRVNNPASGASIAVYLDLPSTPPPHKAVVVVPGGLSDASGVFKRQQLRDRIASLGVAVVRFDPDGRGNSGGTDDLYGDEHQAGLKAVIEAIIARDDIADDQVGVFSNSMGVIMATGALKNEQTSARFLIDWEGPSDRQWVGACLPGGARGHSPIPDDVSCEDDSYWNQREAEQHIAQLSIPYQRIQRVHDHVHDTEHGHAHALYEAALDGDSPWVRMNLLQPNLAVADVKTATMPNVGFATLYDWYPDYIEDMFALVNEQALPTRQHSMDDGQGSAPRSHGGGDGGPPHKGKKHRKAGGR